MKNSIILMLLFATFTFAKAQQENNAATNLDAILKIEADAKAKTLEGNDLKKQALAKRLQAIKEKDKTINATLKNEAALLDQQAKLKTTEALNLRKDALSKRQMLKQQNINNKVVLGKAPMYNISKNNNIILGDYIEIFEQPNYSGNSIKFKKNTDQFNIKIPFVSNNISIKFSNQLTTILFITNDATQTITTLTESTPNLTINTANIALVKVGTKKILEVNFNGLIYNVNFRTSASGIHNNDCKKIYGLLEYKIEMQLRNRMGFAKTNLIPIGESASTNPNNFIQIFNLPKYKDFAAPYIYSAADKPLSGLTLRRMGKDFARENDKALITVPNLPNATKTFYIDSASYDKINIKDYKLIANVKIGSAHKGCDICTDFTWDAEMKTNDEIKIELPHNKITGYTDATKQKTYAFDFIQIGPFRDTNFNGQYTKKDNYIGPEHATYIQFTTRRINK